MKSPRALRPFSLNASSSPQEILQQWAAFADRKYRAEDFQGQLRLLPAPRVAVGTYKILSKSPELRLLINTAVGEEWYGEPSNLHSEFPAFVEVCPSLVRSGDVIFDCGAHQGVYSLLFSAECGPSGRVVAFEVVPINADLARLNADINSCGNIDVFAVGLYSRAGTTTVSQQDHSIKEATEGRRDVVRVPLLPLDKYERLRPTLIKLDVEGAEIDALIGARTLLRTPRRWVISIHPPFLRALGHEPGEVFTYLPFRDYDCFIVYPGRPAGRYHGEFELETFCELAFFPRGAA